MKLLFLLLFSISTMFAQKILIPLYSYPNWYDTSYQWNKIPASKDTYVIINPNNGPGKTINKDYQKGIEDLKKQKLNIIGYIYTSYGKRPLSSVKADINLYSKNYKDVKGIFFDETSSKAKEVNYYKELAIYAKSKGIPFIVLNPGTIIDKAYINSGFADIIVTFEEYETNWLNNFPENQNNETRRTKKAVLLHDSLFSNLEKNKKLAKDRGFSYIYFTDDKSEDNPWDNLSSYLSKH